MIVKFPSTRCGTAACALLVLLSISVTAVAQPPGRRPMRRPTERPDASQDAEKEKAAEQDAQNQKEQKAEKPIVAIVGGDIYTVTKEVIRRGTILVQDGKILEIGQDVTVPEGAETIDATGKIITPGFVAIEMSNVGLRSSNDREAKLTDLLDPFDRNIKLSLGVGITSGCVELGSGGRRFRRGQPEERFPGLQPLIPLEDDPEFNWDFNDANTSQCPCCGLPILPTEPITPTPQTTITPQKSAVVKMNYGQLENMMAKEDAFFDLSAGSLSGGLNRHQWRESVVKARQYLADQAKHEEQTKAGNKDSKPPRKPVSDELLAVVKRELPVRIQADSYDEIRDMIALAKELDYRLVLSGVAEGWLATEQLSETMTPVVITPRQRRNPYPGREDQSGSSIETSGLLEQSGVPFAVAALSDSISLNGLAGRDLTSLPLEAAFAVRGGCSEKAALEALTIVPARMLGLEDRIGSLEQGKDADLLILNGPPLDYRTYVELAFVNGRVCYDRAKDRVYPVYDRR